MTSLRRFLIAALAAATLLFFERWIADILPLFGANPGTMTASLIVLTIIFLINGFGWILQKSKPWIHVITQYSILIASLIVSSYHRHFVCSSNTDFLDCLDKSSKLASLGDGIGTIALIAFAIWLWLGSREANQRGQNND